MDKQVNEVVKKTGSITGVWVLGMMASLIAAFILILALLGFVRTVPQVIFGLVVAVIAVFLFVLNRRNRRA
jgi:multisubunit Na+/H+ antiporter MnhE subunit